MANLFWDPVQGEPNHACGLAGDDTNQRQNMEWIQAYDKKRVEKTRTLNNLCWCAFLFEVKRNGRRYSITHTNFNFSKGKKAISA